MSSFPLTGLDFFSISPLLALVVLGLGILMIESFISRPRKLVFGVTLFGLFVTLGLLWVSPSSSNLFLVRWIQFDAVSLFFSSLFLLIGAAVVLLGDTFLKQFKWGRSEFYFFLVASLFGLILVAQSADFLTLFIGIETLSLSLYVLCAYMKKWDFSHEAAMKYFLMGALSTAFLLFGVALIYGAIGTTRFDLLLGKYKEIQNVSSQLLFLTGIAFITLGLAFKAAVVPFHTWAPDVYAGAPSPVTALMATGTKVGAFIAFIRIFLQALPEFEPVWYEMIAWLGVPTLIYANWVALKQTQLRRFFAYSGISHAGYLFLGVAAGTQEAISAISFYLVIYAAATLGAFAVIVSIEKKESGLELSDLKGLFQRSPFLAGVMTLCLLTLAGLPPTAGFLAKFYLFKVAFEQGYYLLVFVGLAAALFALFYYTRIIAFMFMEKAETTEPPSLFSSAVVCALGCFLAILLFSILPKALMAFL